MKPHFEWHSQDDTERVALPSRQPDAAHRSLRPLAVPLIAIAFLIGALVWLLDRRQDETVNRLHAEVLSVFELQQLASLEQDKELFTSFMASGDELWKREQWLYFDAGLFHGRDAVGLKRAPGGPPEPSIAFSPDLNIAEVTFTERYVPTMGGTGQKPLALTHKRFYQRVGDHWLLAPNSPRYWGGDEKLVGRYVVALFPARDAALVSALVKAIERELEALCAGGRRAEMLALCEQKVPVQLRFSKEAASLATFGAEMASPSTYLELSVPTPSLLGTPATPADLDSYLPILIAPIIEQIGLISTAASSLPQQDIFALCFDHPLLGRRLFRYDLQSRAWAAEVPGQRFTFLSALPDNSELFLMDRDELMLYDPQNRLAQGVSWQSKKPFGAEAAMAGWLGEDDRFYQLLRQPDAAGGRPTYALLDLEGCRQGKCMIEELPGFPVWNAHREATLYASGSEIWLDGGNGERRPSLGRGFNPFWLEGDTFGFVRFTGEAGQDLTSEIVVGHADNDDLEVIVDGHILAEAAGISSEDNVFVNAVLPNPSRKGMLLVTGTGIKSNAGNYYLFSIEFSADGGYSVTHQLTRHGGQGGVPGMLTPTGPYPFLVSDDGRWLAMTELAGGAQELWTVVLHDLQQGLTTEVSRNVPAMPGRFPLLDWSGEGNWLLIAGRDSFQLLSPADEQQVIVPHDFDVCTHINWAG